MTNHAHPFEGKTNRLSILWGKKRNRYVSFIYLLLAFLAFYPTSFAKKLIKKHYVNTSFDASALYLSADACPANVSNITTVSDGVIKSSLIHPSVSTDLNHLFALNPKDRIINLAGVSPVYVAANLKDAAILEYETRNLADHSIFHLFSHGQAGELLIDGQWKDATQLANWLQKNQLLDDKSFLYIYGCEFGKGEKGNAAVKHLETVLGISVAASDDITGRDGDWELEIGEAIHSIQVSNYGYNLQCTSVSGAVYGDYDLSGIFDTGESGIQGVDIEVFDMNNSLVGSSTSMADGSYNITGLASGEYRVEFSNLPVDHYAGNYGSESMTTVIFTQISGCSDLNLGLVSLDAYCNKPDNNVIAATCFVQGAIGNTTGPKDVIVSFVYQDTVDKSIMVDANNDDVGSVWGLASILTEEATFLFSSAFLKRHVGLGSEGLGGIYLTENPGTGNSSTSSFIDLEDCGIDLGATLLGSRDLSPDPLSYSRDPSAFGLIGEAGLGGMAPSEDGSMLYVMDLANKVVRTIDISGFLLNGTLPTCTDVGVLPSYPSVSCSGGVDRPFALTQKDGKLFLGLVCDGSISGNSSDLEAFVYEYDIAGGTWNSSPVLSINSLDYQRGLAFGFLPIPSLIAGMTAKFNAWTDQFSDFNVYSCLVTDEGCAVYYPQPMLTDIEFTDTGDMVIGFADRAGHQALIRQLPPTITDWPPGGDGPDANYSVTIGGEVLYAGYDAVSGNYVLENNGTSINGGGCGPGVNLAPGATAFLELANHPPATAEHNGPGGGEYFCGDEFNTVGDNGFYFHNETSNGGLAIFPNTDELVLSAMDPGKNFSGGVSWLDLNSGELKYTKILYRDIADPNSTSPIEPAELQGTSGKAAGIGDAAIFCPSPPVEIGNYVWEDTNGNGLQDPDEAPISGLQVELLKDGNVIATATTDANGNYIFSNNWSGTSTSSHIYDIQELMPNMNYVVRFPTSIGDLSLTTTNAGSKDIIDSDADAFGEITVQTTDIPTAAANNHSFDVGFLPNDLIACGTGGLNLARWWGVPGSDVDDLTNFMHYPDNPSESTTISSFQGPSNIGDDYGTRVRGYIIPSETGMHMFNITSDNASTLYLSTDDDPANANSVASILDWAGVTEHNDPAEPNQASPPIMLTAGQAYYVELLHKEDSGGDHFQVYWQTPSNSTWTIIPSSNLAHFSPTITATLAALSASCTGNIPNDDAYLQISATTADRYTYVMGSTFTGDPDYANASLVPATLPAIVENGISNPGMPVDYTFRLFDGSSDCYIDITTTLNPQNCITACNCSDYVYLNEPTTGNVHKFRVNTDGTLTEIGSPWYFGNELDGSSGPHGLGIDLNGNIYIGEDADPSQIRKFNCNGEISPVSSFDYFSKGQYNIGSIGNTFYYNPRTGTENIVAVDICSASEVGYLNLCGLGNNFNDWGFYVDPRTEVMYATTGFDSNVSGLWRFEANDFTASGNPCISPMALVPPLPAASLRGVTTDVDGNIYIAVFDDPSIGGGSYLLKYNSSGSLLAQSAVDNSGDMVGFHEVMGIVYSETSNLIYASMNDNNEPCVTSFTTDLQTVAISVPHTGINGKGIGIVTECCPTNNNEVIEITACAESLSDPIFLNEIFPCDGVVCEGQWTPSNQAAADIYDACNQTIIAAAPTGCYTYSRSSDGTGANNQCGAFLQTLIICITSPPIFDPPTSAVGDCTGGIPNDNATITITNISNADVVGVSSAGASTYNGSGYDASATASDLFLVSGGVVTITGLEHGQDYIVRIFNQGDGCNEEVTVTTATITPLSISFTKVDDTDCMNLNSGSIDITASGGTGGYIYDWADMVGTNDTEDRTGLTAGDYFLTVTDANSCIQTEAITILGTECVAVGNYVFMDANDNGTYEAGTDMPIESVAVELYVVGANPGIDPALASTTTSATGYYYFDNLNAGDYFVYIPSINFNVGQPLENKESYPGADATDTSDGDDNGEDIPVNGGISSNIFTLTPNNEPTGEDQTDYPGSLDDDNINGTIDFTFRGLFDYGDLPDSYSTLAASNGASHSLKTGLYLGSCVDFEPTGSPDFEAGTDGSSGDDQTPGLLTEGSCVSNDDEDGITLLTPLIPGSTACIEVTATSVNGTAVLNAWIDFNGDGDFAGDANENLVFTSIDGAPIGATTDAPVANGTGTYVYCFDVPSDATFPNQETHMRFRLSMNGGLPYNGPSDSGEVEDYYQPLAKLGNIVWEDVNGNAIQDGGEPGFAGVDVTITSTDLQGNPVSVTVTTGADGMYMFPGLLPGEEYCIHFDISNAPNAGDLIFTPQDVPFNMDEVNDSDADVQTGDAGCYILNPLEYNPDVDAGVYYDADGDLIPDSPDGNMELNPQGYIYCEDSGEIIPGGLVQVTAGPGVVNMIQDGSTGEYQFFVSQPGTYTLSFTPPAGYVVSTACLDQGLLDPDPMDPSPFIVGSDDADNDGFLDDSSCGANTFYMQFTLEVGEFILQNNIPLSCAEIGDTVWEDNDTDGVQDPGEPGVPDIAVLLFECAGGVKGSQIGSTTTDASGNYEFTGLPGNVEYCVQFDLASSTNPNAGLYFFTTQDQTLGGGDDTNDSDANPVDGCTTSENVAPGEEYDDFDAGVYLIDMGDLIEGTGYPTTLANMGAAHSVPSAGALLKLGATVDAETDGQPSVDALGDGVDEDGVILPMFMTGIPEDIDVSVMNMTGSEAKLVMFVDWNNDGDFDDVNEMYSVMVPDGATVVTLDDVTPPLTANLAVPIGVRFRISTDQAVVMSPTGLAPDGEVEDYVVSSMGFDYGDLNDVVLGTTGDPGQPLTPADYQTTFTDNGPRHKIITDINDNPILKIGSAVDDEADGQPSADAGITGGDDNAIAPGTSDPDDEDGLDENNLPLFIITQTTTLDIPVMNMTGADATIAVFVDFNKDGTFDPGTERFEAPVPDMATTVSVNIPVPLSSVIGQDVGLRIRLANEATETQTAVGLALSGEVEDYMVQIVGFDYGDLPDSYGTTDPDGPKHIVNEDLLLGSCVDVELDGQEEAMAGLMSGGDDNGTGLVTFRSCATAGDDEDGIMFTSPLIPGNEACIEVTSVNNTGSDAVLQMWVDYNGDGAFGAGEEVSFTSANANTIPDGGTISEDYCFNIPTDASFQGGAAFVRFRLSPNGGTVADGQDINAVQFGEIEDYKVPLYKVGSYVWDDLNGDGLQDDFSSPCMDDVEMQLVWGGPDDNLATTGDNQTYLVTSDEVNSIHGQFVFCGLIPGSYELSIADIPGGLAPTVIGAGVDPNYDSNDPTGVAFSIPVNAVLPTGEDGVGDQPGGINGFPDTQDNLSFDFGLMTDGYTITCNCDGSITLDWDPFAGGDSWTVTLEDENGFPALDFVNMPDHVVTIAPGSLNNGECYRVAITENLSGNEVTSIYGPFHANCYPVPAISMTGVGPTCPDSQDGEVTITITEQGCAATYDVYLTSQNSGELLVGDDIQITAPIVVGGLGEDTYGVRMELVDRGNCAYGDLCFPLIENDLLFLQNTDTEPPTKLVYDASGAEVTDMVINYDALPEGECGVQFSWSVVLNDNCLSAGVNLAASITTSSANPSVTPSASVTVLDNTPTYAVEVFAGVGTNTLTLTATDFNGNENVMVYTINVADNRDPVLYCPTDMNVEIPSCEDEAPVNWTVSVVDDCDLSPTLTQTSGPASGDVLAPGVYNVSYEATDDYGNTASCSFTITVTQAPSPTPIVDVSGNGNYEIEHCEEDGLIVFSGNVYDCDLDAASFNPADLIVQTTPLSPGAAGSLQISYTLPQDGYVYFEATGNLTAGSYLIITSYQGVTVDHGVIVSQDADQPAVIDMPGNLSYQAPDCEAEVPVSFAVQLSDDCDEDLGSASFTVNGAPAPPYDAAASNPTHGLYVWNLSLSAGTYTIVGTYTDGGGNTTVQQSTITVNGTQDDWAPIITYPSQNMDIELDPCGPDEQEVCFEVSATDDCSGDVTPSISVTNDSGNTVNLTNPSGNTYCMVLGPGTYSVDISASDAAGNTTSEDFVINITQDDPPLAALICNDDINVTLDDNCQREITADMLLEGEFGCYENEDFAITIQDDDPSNGNILDGCGEFIYEITLIGGDGPIDFQPCWGYITGEDKTAPVLECPASTGTGTIVKNGYILSGTIDTDDPTVVVNDWSCLIDNAQPASAGERYVDILPFQVDVSDVYTFLVESDVTQTGNVGFAIYQASYDIDNPCENIIAQSDILNDGQGNGVGNPLPGAQTNDAYVRLALPLQAGATYYLATTTFTPEATGNYQYSICSDDNGQVGYFDTTYVTNPDWSVDEIVSFTPVPTSPVTIELPLHCEDFDAIYNNPSSLSLVGSPIVSDNCDQDVEVSFEDTYEQFGDCGDIVITRTFTAVDDKGNSSSCTQVITLSSVIANNRGDSEVWLPPFTVPIECDEDYPTLANGNPTPAIAGYPFVYTVSGIFDLTQGQYCNVGASFEDSPSIVVCDGAFKFTRTWTIVDWCNPIDFYTYAQIIKVGDFTAPTVTCPGEDYDWDGILDAPVYSTSPFACTAAFEVPLPAVEDNCSDYEVYTEIVTAVEVDVVDQYGQVTGTELDTITVRIVEWDAATRYVSGIPMGAHYFYYLVEDDCGNQTEVYCPFSVEDQIEPTAVCDDDLHVSIAGNDYARIYAEDIDEGSWDNCGIASIEVRRNLFDPINFTCGNSYSLWGDYVDFFCCDAGVEIEIQLRVIDEAGNINTCWLNVSPEEKVRPYCEAPHNVEVDCTELPYDFDAYDTDQLEALFGSAIATDNCSGAAADELPPVVDLECGFGRIIRRFRATDGAGNQSTNFCQQIVDISEVHNYEIRFPADAEAICGVADPDSVIYEELACDLLAVSHTDEFFSASGEECYKIFRTWKVINWCEYDGESAPLVIGRDEDCDGQPGDEAVWVLRRPNGYIYIDRDNDETEPNNVPLAFQNICQGWDDFWRKEDSTPGYYEYTQIIKVYDDVDPIITAEDQTFCSYDNVNCDGVVVYPFSVEENCTPEDLTIKVFLDAGADGIVDVNLTETNSYGFSLTGTYPDYTIGGEYPIGCHAFEVHVEDGCGNVAASLLPFCVEDCKAPAPICINGLAIELMPFDVDGDDVPDEGRMAIWASDFIASPITDCSDPVVYSMNRSGEPKNIDSTGIVLTCADLGTLVVEIWAWDAAGNSDFCETYINVQDNMGNCTASSPAIAGAVETEYEAPVEDVTISLSGQGTASMQTGADGTYSFTGLVEGYDYTVIPERDGDYLNGVSTFDLVLISQHILGVQPLDSPYKRIAADVNNSESITTLDLIQLRKLILSIDTEFSNNTSWRFVDAAYVFPNPQDPWEEVFPELVNVNDLSEYGIAGVDFIAVKIGDVTEDAETTSLLAVEGRTVESTLYLQAEEVSMQSGQEYTINFSIEELQSLYGYQATLNFNTEAVELVDILEGVASEDNFGFTYLDEGMVTTSWNLSDRRSQAGWVPDTEEELSTTVMYSLVLRAKADVNLSEVMSVSSRITKAEAYGVDGELMDVDLSFGLSAPMVKGKRFELYQNQPNPANGETLIGFNLPAAATATLTISDITGRAIKLIRLDAVKGYNSVVINTRNLPKGVLQYTLKAGQYTDTKSMIIMD